MVVVINSHPGGSHAVVTAEESVLSAYRPDQINRRMGLARSMHAKTQGDGARYVRDLGLGPSPAGKPEKTAACRNPNLSRHSKNRPRPSIAGEGVNGGKIRAPIRASVEISTVGSVKSGGVGSVGSQQGSRPNSVTGGPASSIVRGKGRTTVAVPRRHYKMAAVGRDCRRIHLIRPAVARHRTRARLPIDAVVGGIGDVRRGSSAVSGTKDNIRIRLCEIDSISVGKYGIAIHAARRRLAQVGVAHPRDVTKGTEKNSTSGGRVHVRNRFFLNTIIFKGPGHARGLGSSRDI